MIFDLFITIFCLISSWKSNVVYAKVYLEDIDVLFVNYTYIDEDTFDISLDFKPQSINVLSANIDVLKETEKEIYVHFSVASRSFGYEFPTGVGFKSNMCKERLGMEFFEKVVKRFGITECPPKKGSYILENYEPDFSKSSFLVSGAHLSLDLQIYAEDEKIIELKVLAGKVYIEDINILYFNDTYIDKDTFDVSINYKPNLDNTLNAYIDAIKEADKEIIVQLSISTRSMGYEIPLGVGFTSKLCKSTIGKGVFDQIVKPFGIQDCPPKKGLYSIEDFGPDFSKASFLVSGAHLSLDFQVFAEDEKIVRIKAFIVA